MIALSSNDRRNKAFPQLLSLLDCFLVRDIVLLLRFRLGSFSEGVEKREKRRNGKSDKSIPREKKKNGRKRLEKRKNRTEARRQKDAVLCCKMIERVFVISGAYRSGIILT